MLATGSCLSVICARAGQVNPGQIADMSPEINERFVDLFKVGNLLLG